MNVIDVSADTMRDLLRFHREDAHGQIVYPSSQGKTTMAAVQMITRGSKGQLALETVWARVQGEHVRNTLFARPLKLVPTLEHEVRALIGLAPFNATTFTNSPSKAAMLDAIRANIAALETQRTINHFTRVTRIL